jgi:hypothetical protein
MRELCTKTSQFLQEFLHKIVLVLIYAVLPSSLLNEINALSLGETVLLIIIFLSNHTLQYNLLHRNQIHFQCIYYTIFFCFSIIDQLVQ